jgi:hypothetical protein
MGTPLFERTVFTRAEVPERAVVNFQIDRTALPRLDAAARRRKVSRAEWIRALIAAALEAEPG